VCKKANAAERRMQEGTTKVINQLIPLPRAAAADDRCLPTYLPVLMSAQKAEPYHPSRLWCHTGKVDMPIG
jgi:hypothetical protein